MARARRLRKVALALALVALSVLAAGFRFDRDPAALEARYAASLAPVQAFLSRP